VSFSAPLSLCVCVCIYLPFGPGSIWSCIGRIYHDCTWTVLHQLYQTGPRQTLPRYIYLYIYTHTHTHIYSWWVWVCYVCVLYWCGIRKLECNVLIWIHTCHVCISCIHIHKSVHGHNVYSTDTCLYVCTYMCAHTFTRTHTHVAHIHTHMYIQVYMYYIHICTWKYVYMCIYAT